jgi:hypothetical protein
VEAGTGLTTRIDAMPAPSPDGKRFVTASLDLVAGHSPNRIRIYHLDERGPTVEWEVEPREWGATNPRWVDDRTIELDRGMVDWNTIEIRTSPMVLRRDAGRWTVEASARHAADALTSFFSALARELYLEASWVYGGSYALLQDWNPDTEPSDLPALWRAACEHNGLRCMGRAEVVRTEVGVSSSVRVTVRFLTDDGTPFVLGPCCGETPATMPPVDQFAFSVRRVGERYLVQDLPVYTP